MNDYGLSLFTFAVVLLGGAGLYLLLPRGPGSESRPVRWTGGILATLSLVLIAAYFGERLGNLSNSLAFYVMAATSVTSAVMMITARNPVFAALWFALVLLSNSGLFLLQGAEFLAAATIIIYAGAIIVIFLFVIMLAQPRGTARYDRYTREPMFSCVAGVILAGTLVGTLHYSVNVESLPPTERDGGSALPPAAVVQAVAQQVDRGDGTSFIRDDQPHVLSLGRALFEDHFVSIEVIGILLLVAVVGAVVISGHSGRTAQHDPAIDSAGGPPA